MFFGVLKQGRKIHTREKSLAMVDMCDALTIPLAVQNFKEVRKFFVDRAFDVKPHKRKALPLDDKRTADIFAASLNAVAHLVRPHG